MGSREKEEKQNSFIIHLKYRKQLEKMSDSERGKLLINLMDVFEGKEPTYELEEYTEGAFDFMAEQMLFDVEKYRQKCERNRQAIRERWERKEKENQNADTNVYECTKRNTY